MNAVDIRYPVPLETKPTVLEAGYGRHGHRPERFRHDGFWSLQLCGDPATLTIGDIEVPLTEGAIVMRPPYQPLRYEYHADPWRSCFFHFLAHSLAMQPVEIPLIQYGVEGFQELWDSVVDLANLLEDSPLQAEVRAWDVLWRVARLSHQAMPKHTAPPVSPAVQKAMDMIDLSKPGHIDIDQVVAASGVSHTHLNRLFRQELGANISEHIRKRAIERAKKLLHFTNMPLKAVADQIGMSDLQRFNKFIRREFGVSPRAYRAEFYRSRLIAIGDADLGPFAKPAEPLPGSHVLFGNSATSLDGESG